MPLNHNQSCGLKRGKIPIRPKSLGKGVMVITELDGLLMLSNSELVVGKYNNKLGNSLTMELQARTSERFLAQVTSAMAIAEFKYPKDLNTLVWLFDQPSCHCACKEDVFNVKHMNVKPGSFQPTMESHKQWFYLMEHQRV